MIPRFFLEDTQEKIASKVNATRTRVNITLQALKDRGYISIDGRKVVVKNRDALRRLILAETKYRQHDP